MARIRRLDTVRSSVIDREPNPPALNAPDYRSAHSQRGRRDMSRNKMKAVSRSRKKIGLISMIASAALLLTLEASLSQAQTQAPQSAGGAVGSPPSSNGAAVDSGLP